jgi:hypothetical protein
VIGGTEHDRSQLQIEGSQPGLYDAFSVDFEADLAA